LANRTAAGRPFLRVQFGILALLLCPLTAAAGDQVEQVAQTLASGNGPAQAEAATDKPLISGHIGPALLYSPDYLGSDDYELSAAPAIDLNIADVFLIEETFTGLGLFALKGPKDKQLFAIGGLLHYDGGRDEDDNDALEGLGDINPTLEGGAFALYQSGGFSMKTGIVHDLADGHEGLLVLADIGYRATVSENLWIQLDAGATWADDRYMQSYFGIDGSQAAGSAYDSFDAGAGFRDVEIRLTSAYSLSPTWRVLSGVTIQQLLGDAADSPIVAESGSATQANLFMGLVYEF